MVAALGTCMAQMSAAFTLKGKKYAEHHDVVRAIADKLHRAQSMLRQLVDEDMAAYGLYDRVSRLPKDDPTKAEQTRLALTTAIAVPEEIVATAGAVLEEVERLLPVCNPHLLSDVGVAAIVCEAAARAASLNIRVNLGQLGDAAAADELRGQVKTLLMRADEIRRRIETELAERF